MAEFSAATWGAVTGTVALGLSLWNAWWAQRERIRVRIVQREGLASEAGMTRVYLLVANVSPFEVMLETASIVTVDPAGRKKPHRLTPIAGEFPLCLPSRQAARFPLSMQATIFAAMEEIDSGYAVTSTGVRGRTPRRWWQKRKRLREIMPPAAE